MYCGQAAPSSLVQQNIMKTSVVQMSDGSFNQF